MKHEEKLAFWINVHNALVMHVKNTLVLQMWFLFIDSVPLWADDDQFLYCEQAFLAYGIPQNNVKRVYLLLKVRRASIITLEIKNSVFKFIFLHFV